MIRRAGVCVAGALALLGMASAAGAARWIDKYGRILMLQAPGLTEAELASGARSVDQAAGAFKSLCLDTALDRAAAGRAAEAAGFSYRAQSMPFKQPVDVGSWVATDAEMTVARDMFFAKDPQCNLAVALPGPPNRAAAIAALSALVGQPANAAKANKKDGTPDGRWQPEWVVAGEAGNTRHLFLHQHQPNVVQFAAIERKGAK